MQTNFSAIQLQDPDVAESESIIRKCVHCGFCTATCPTYVLLGDELDSPRGRIYLIKDMLENERQPDAEVVKHIDRCLSCLACVTTCPSGVDYMHLIDHGRAYVQERYRRPWLDRFYRRLLAVVLPHQGRFRLALVLAKLARPFSGLLNRAAWSRPLGAMLSLAPGSLPLPTPANDSAAEGSRGRVIMQRGCAEPVLKPEYRAAGLRLLNRFGFDVSFAGGEGCCGALVQHMGRAEEALVAARRNIDAWMPEIDRGDIKAIIVTASGCGTTVKDYGHMLRNDPGYAEKAATCSALARDISEFLMEQELPEDLAGGTVDTRDLVVAYHSACSLQHGQKRGAMPKQLLEKAGFAVRMPAEAHLCCGSAGTYNILQAELSAALSARKADNIRRLNAQVVATTNIGCAVQLGNALDLPVVHVIELVDWASGGPKPGNLL